MFLKYVDNIVFDYDMKDYPDFADATIVSADYRGVPIDNHQLDELNEHYTEFIHEKLIEHLY